jgi:hypothetical protein
MFQLRMKNNIQKIHYACIFLDQNTLVKISDGASQCGYDTLWYSEL